MLREKPMFVPEKSDESRKKSPLKKIIAGGMAAGMIAGAAEKALATNELKIESNGKTNEYKMETDYSEKELKRIESHGKKLVFANKDESLEEKVLLKEAIPKLVVDTLTGKVSDKEFCSCAEKYWNQAQEENLTEEPWMKPFKKLRTEKCGLRI